MEKQKLNILLIGDAAVGKSTLLEMYFDKIFTSAYLATIGLDFFEKA